MLDLRKFKRIGNVGVDQIKISGIKLPSKCFEEPIWKNTLSTLGNPDPDSAKGIIKSDRGFKIDRHWFVFDVGKLPGPKESTNYYATLTLSACPIVENNNDAQSNYNKNDNVQNMTVAEVHVKFHRALNVLHQEYGLKIPYNMDYLSITHLEMNKTFLSPISLETLRNITDIMIHANKSPYGEFGNEKHEQETIYIIKKETFTAKIYDKTAEMEKKGISGFPKNMLRFEITYSQPQNAKKFFHKQQKGESNNLLFKNFDETGLINTFFQMVNAIFKNTNTWMDSLFAEKPDREKYLLLCLNNIISTLYQTNKSMALKAIMEPILLDKTFKSKFLDESYMFSLLEELNIFHPELLQLLKNYYPEAIKSDYLGYFKKYYMQLNNYQLLRTLLTADSTTNIERSA